MMRTTLTLDPDVAAKLKKRMAEKGATMKQVVNEALRTGLSATGPLTRKKYRVRTFSSKLRPGYDWTRFNEVLDELEVEDFLRTQARAERDADTGR